jgi:hypothetical protein
LKEGFGLAVNLRRLGHHLPDRGGYVAHVARVATPCQSAPTTRTSPAVATRSKLGDVGGDGPSPAGSRPGDSHHRPPVPTLRRRGRPRTQPRLPPVNVTRANVGGVSGNGRVAIPVGQHLPDRGQGAESWLVAMVWQTASPRAHVATPGAFRGACGNRHPLPDRGQRHTPVPTSRRRYRTVAWASLAITCRIVAKYCSSVAIATTIAPCPRRDAGALRGPSPPGSRPSGERQVGGDRGHIVPCPRRDAGALRGVGHHLPDRGRATSSTSRRRGHRTQRRERGTGERGRRGREWWRWGARHVEWCAVADRVVSGGGLGHRA